MLSSKAKYALRALVCLAEAHRSDGWILASEIAAAEAIPKKFLEAILVELRDQGLGKKAVAVDTAVTGSLAHQA